MDSPIIFDPNDQLLPEIEVFDPNDQLQSEIEVFNPEDILPSGDGSSPPVIIGVDTEYTALECGSLHILSYQFYLLTATGESTQGIVYTKSRRKSDRVSLNDFILDALEQAFQEGLIRHYPSTVYIATFFARADLAHFKEVFKGLKTTLQSSRRTIASLDSTSTYGIDAKSILSRHMNKASLAVYDPDILNNHRVNIRFYDVMLLVPNGRSLEDVGQMLGLSKLSIPEPYSITRMDEYLKADKQGFENYALRDAEIAAKYLDWFKGFANTQGLSRIPPTVGGMAVSLFRKGYVDEFSKDQLDDSFNQSEVVREFWPKEGDNKSLKPLTKRLKVPEATYGDFEQFAINCYHGGYNICFEMGPTEISSYNDFDIRSCYTTALLSVRPLDFSQLQFSRNPSDFEGDVLGLVYVAFKFPPDCQYPCLPVRSDNFGLIYPLEGNSHCTSHELALALRMGCELTIQHGLIIPWKSEHQIFGSFMREVREKRNSYTKGSLEERLWKELGNSLYGKTAQGLRAKTGFELDSGLSKKISKSAITHPYFAAYITGVARALLHELILSIPSNRTVISATTDGFLTDATRDEISLDGPVARLFTDWHAEIDPNAKSILELKHGAQQLVAMKTRGQLTAIPHADPVIEAVTAKAGVRVPKGFDGNMYTLDLYLNRQPGQKVDASHLISTRDQFTRESDLIMIEKEQRLSLEFDFKRDLVNPVMREVCGHQHIACNSVPFRTEAEQAKTRRMFDNWRKHNCLKTLDDFFRWEEYRLLSGLVARLTAKGMTSIRIQQGETLASVYARLFCRGYMQGCWGFPAAGSKRPVKHPELATVFEEAGVIMKTSTISQAKNRRLIEGELPFSPLLLPLIRQLLLLFPKFDPCCLIQDSDQPALRTALDTPPVA